MNNKSLYTVGGAALLATTALSSNANAVSILTPAALNSAPTAFSAKAVATELFSATTTTANAVTIQGTVTATGGILIDVSPTFASFDLKLDISSSTAAFNTAATPTVSFYAATTSGTLELLLLSVTGCTLQPSAERLTFLACNPTGQTAGTTGSKVDAIVITGIGYTSAAALKTAGTNVTLSGATYLANSSSTIDTIAATSVLTSKSAVADASVKAGSTATIDNNASPAFTLLVASGSTTTTTAVLGSIVVSASGAYSTDLATTFSAASAISVVSSAEVRVVHSAFSDSALTNISFSGTTRAGTSVTSNVVTFTVSGASLTTSGIVATFNGTSAISETTGTATATVTPTALSPLAVAISSFSGSLARLSRGGLSVELNSILPGALKAQYISFLRINNQSSLASTATLTLKSDSTGTAFGTITTDSIAAGGTLSINSSDIDAKLTAAGITLPTTTYKVVVTGSFNGYVQNMLYNVASGAFADASGFRNGTLTTDP